MFFTDLPNVVARRDLHLDEIAEREISTAIESVYGSRVSEMFMTPFYLVWTLPLNQRRLELARLIEPLGAKVTAKDREVIVKMPRNYQWSRFALWWPVLRLVLLSLVVLNAVVWLIRGGMQTS